MGKDQIAKLEKKKALFDNKIAAFTREAQQCMKQKNKKGALAKLKLKKQYEKRNDNLDAQIFNLETQVMSLDDMLMNLGMLEATKNANKAMKGVMGDDPDKMLEEAEQTQEDIQEAMELNNELAAIMGAPLVDFSEDDEEMLAAFEEEMMDEELGLKPQVAQVADEKKDEPELEEEDDDEFAAELRKMENQMDMQPRVRREVQVATSSQSGAPPQFTR